MRLNDFIAVLERALGVQARRELLPLQGGDLVSTCADGSAFQRDFGFSPATPLETGIARFVAWYRDYFGG